MPTTAAAPCLQWGGLGFAQRAMVQMVGEGYTQRPLKKSLKNDVVIESKVIVGATAGSIMIWFMEFQRWLCGNSCSCFAFFSLM